MASFVVSRVLMAVLAAYPDVYTPHIAPIDRDLHMYIGWAQRILRGEMPYVDVRIEYPPGTLPFIVAPSVAKTVVGIPYRLGFIGGMIVIDAAVLYVLTRLSRRRGTRLPLWVWVIGLPLLGPVCWLRLDLLPALTTVWALERLAAGRWVAVGASLGLGAVVKVYPAFLLPSALVIAARRWQTAVAAGAAVTLFLLPLAGAMPALTEDVVLYHARRGIQLDSTWSNLVLLAAQFGYDVTVALRFGAMEVICSAVPVLKLLSTTLSVAIVVASAWISYRCLSASDVEWIAALWFAVLALLLLTGSVLSPQFLVWLLAMGAGACVFARSRRPVAILLLSAAALTQVLYPFLYSRLRWGMPDAVLILSIRNGLLAALAVVATREVRFNCDSSRRSVANS